MKIKIKIKISILISILFILDNVEALPVVEIEQEENKTTYNDTQPLSIGDKVPNIVFKEVMNYKSKTAKLSDFTSSLTILDFWSTSCTSCIALFPHMQSLKNKYKGQLNIVLVNSKTQEWNDNPQKINRILQLQKQRNGVDITLPIVLNSKEIDVYFPAQTLPEEVWLNAKGEILAITYPGEVNEQNIKAILEGRKIKMPVKKDAMIDLQKTTLQQWLYGSADEEHTAVYSSVLIKGYIDGLHNAGLRRGDSSQPQLETGWYYTNQPAFFLLTSAFSNVIRVPYNQILVETKDTAKFLKIRLPDTSASFRRDAYSYDITLPATNDDSVLKYVQEDLCKAFNVTVTTGRKSINCLIVSKTNSTRLSSNTSKKEWNTEGEGVKKYLHGYPIKEVLDYLNQFATIPLIDSTGEDAVIDIDLPTNLYDLYDLNSLKQCLQNAGFSFNEEQIEMDVAVIKDKN